MTPLLSVILKSSQQCVLAAYFTVLVSEGGLLKNFEQCMLKSLWVSILMYVTLLCKRITLDLKLETWCHFWLCTESCRKSKALKMFRLGCLPHIVLDLPEVWFGCAGGGGDRSGLSEVFSPVRSYLLSSSPECNIFIDAASSSKWMEFLESFFGTAIELEFNQWSYVDLLDENQTLKEVIMCYKEIRTASVWMRRK